LKSKLASAVFAAVALAAVTFGLAVRAQAQTETVLHTFNNAAEGGSPAAGLLLDSSGHLYGTTKFGGNPKYPTEQGVVFRLTLSGGHWQESVLRDIPSEQGSDGGLIQDAAGNLYGTSVAGGSPVSCPAYETPGCGTVFELSPTSSGQWKRTQLYAFTGGADGAIPTATLTFDASGNLYGAAGWGGDAGGCDGSFGCGVIFKLSPSASGAWTETVLHTFTGVNDGAIPKGPVVFDAAGNLYGTTSNSSPGYGMVYELSPTISGPWTETILYTFTNGPDGSQPFGGVVFDSSGNLYGTSYSGGNLADCSKQGCGTVYELSPATGGSWTETTVHTFTGGTDGKNPQAGLIRDAAGNFYGTTSAGGSGKSGTAFELSPGSGGTWTEKILHDFPSSTGDGVNPDAPLIFDAAGNLYGTTIAGGPLGYGTVFEIRP